MIFKDNNISQDKGSEKADSFATAAFIIPGDVPNYKELAELHSQNPDLKYYDTTDSDYWYVFVGTIEFPGDNCLVSIAHGQNDVGKASQYLLGSTNRGMNFSFDKASEVVDNINRISAGGEGNSPIGTNNKQPL